MATKTTVQPMTNRRITAWRPDRQLEGYLFLLPSLIGLVTFVVLPILIALWLSFSDWNLLRAPKFVGVSNYVEISRDPVFWQTLRNTLFYTVLLVPFQLALGLMIALALTNVARGAKFYRVIYFMPVVSSIVAAALVFQWMLNRDYGLISSLFWGLAERTGWPVQPPDWLNDSAWAKPAVVLLALWHNVGFTTVIYIAGLQGVSEDLYNAAEVDGANTWQRFMNVTLPLISPTTFFLLIIQMIGAFQLFSEPYVMTRGEGGPAQSTKSIVMYIIDNALEFGRMGKAAAIAWVLFALIFACTLLQNWLQKRWVFYETGDA